MATEREYLVGLGLAKAGARGRFNLEGKAALEKARAEGVTFDEPAYKANKPAKAVDAAPKAPRVTVTPEAVAPRPSSPEVRETPNSPELRAESRRTGRMWASDGNMLVSYRSCFRCKAKVGSCTCDGGPMAPSGFVRKSESDAFLR